jgi:hypothetical protein
MAVHRFTVIVVSLCLGARFAAAQTAPQKPTTPDPHAGHVQPADPPQAGAWHFMQDAMVYANLNMQGSDRGETEFVGQNWWMGMGGRERGRHHLMFTAMFSLDPATVGKNGYAEIFQVGETFQNRPLIDRQHPHDFLMQASAVWRFALTERTAISIGGAPVGEPALGPVAFMHRPSAFENPTAPLSHHTFDSTHIAMGVINATVERGPWVAEASLFNGREPDEQRWDLMDPGALDSWSGRLWFQRGNWQFQASHGVLKEPEALEPGTIRRTTGSGAWFRSTDDNLRNVFVAWGLNDTEHGRRNAVIGETLLRRGRTSVYGRVEAVQVETGLLLGEAVSGSANGVTIPPTCPSDVHCVGGGEDRVEDRSNTVAAFTVGGILDVITWAGIRGGLGADVTFYGVPNVLQPAYGSRPVSFHLFLRVQREPTGSWMRMWNMRMTQPMAHTADPHAGHQMP